MRDYVKRRHGTDWDDVKQKMDKLLTQASSFIEPLTRLPLVATLLAELLPNLDLKEVPKTRWELFNTVLLSGLIRRDLPDSDAEVVTNDFRQLPPERQEALLLLSALALQGLLATPPKLVFRYADIVEKGKGQSKAVREELLEVAKLVMVSFCEMDELQEVTYYHFLHLSFQEFLAAMSLRYSPGANSKMHGVSRLAYSAKSLMIGERFENFWLFALGFFKTDPVTFFKTLFSNVNIDMRTVNKRQQAMEVMLFMMLQEMVPNVNDIDSFSEEYRFALESISVYLDRKVSNLGLLHHGKFDEPNIQALCHALRLLPSLVTAECFIEPRTSTREVLDALQNQHDLQTLRVYPFWNDGQEYAHHENLEDLKSLMSLLQITSLVNLELEQLHFSDEDFQTLADGLTRMNHSLKHLSLWGGGERRENTPGMKALLSALSKHHKTLSAFEINLVDLYNYSAMQSLVACIDNSNNLARLSLRDCKMNIMTFELLCSAVQRSISLTSLALKWTSNFIVFRTLEERKDLRLRALQLSHVAIHHANITRLEIDNSDLIGVDAMNIVKEVLKTKGEPHQLRQLSLRWNGITEEGVKRLRKVIEENQLNLTIAVENYFLRDKAHLFSGPIVDSLPHWSVC